MFTILITLAITSSVAAVSVWVFTPRPPRFDFIEGRPLLAQDGLRFADEQVGLQFNPPRDWAMQARSTEAPTHRADRLLVKYKRVAENRPEAWLRVRVIDVPAEQSPADFLRNRKSPEEDWKPAKKIEESLRVGGHPAARIVFSGPFDTEGRGDEEFTCEIVAVRQGPQIIEFAGTFLSSDLQARDQLHAVLESMELHR